ncbi:CLUMA_CG007998, isoform A [Clunio marinus]|uniref:Protein SEC13 homolog n=1 Tax=Clunio marinus TaxID=568069 RepID=A0A1J1I4H5_9DIPT|nr:CLUMA_CG007998, isoform A [Clunio marinus]
MVSVLQSIDSGHEDLIHGAEIDYYGLNLATCSSDNCIKIFDIKNGGQRLKADLKGHGGPVWQVAWAHPKFGNILASCSYDRKVIIWKEVNGEWTKSNEYSNHDSSVNSVAFAPHEYGLILACGSSDGSISILTFNTESGNYDFKKIPNAHTIGCNALSWCPSAVPEAAFDQRGKQNQPATNGIPLQVKRFVSGGCDNTVKIWKEDGDRWVEERRLDVHSDWIRDVAWAPSIGLPSSRIASCSQDRRVIIWSTEDMTTWTPHILNTFDDVVWNVSWSLTGNILGVSGGDNKISLWKENNDGIWTCISQDTENAKDDQRVM